MLYRYLYAHNAGLLNDKFVNDYDMLTETSIQDFLDANTYPQEDTYFFQPLNEINQFMEETCG